MFSYIKNVFLKVFSPSYGLIYGGKLKVKVEGKTIMYKGGGTGFNWTGTTYNDISEHILKEIAQNMCHSHNGIMVESEKKGR